MPGAAAAPSPGFAPAAKKAGSPFVSARGAHFVVNGTVTYFSGTNAYFLLLRCGPRPAHFAALCRFWCCPTCARRALHARLNKQPPCRRIT